METNQNQVTKCPITSRPIEVPCKNTRCAHVYERDAILNYIKGKTHRKYFEKQFPINIKT